MGSRSLAMRNRTVNQYIGDLGSKVDNLVNEMCLTNGIRSDRGNTIDKVSSPKINKKRINYMAEDEVTMEET